MKCKKCNKEFDGGKKQIFCNNCHRNKISTFKKNKRIRIKIDLERKFNVSNICFYCGIRIGATFQIDHIIPKSRGGNNDSDNLAIVCASCIRAKLDKDLIFHLNWLSHIRSGEFNCLILKKYDILLEDRTRDKLQKSFF